MPYPLTITYKTAPSTHLQDHLIPQPQSQSTIPQNKDHSSRTCSLLYPEDGDSTLLCDTAHRYLMAGSTLSRLPGSKIRLITQALAVLHFKWTAFALCGLLIVTWLHEVESQVTSSHHMCGAVLSLSWHLLQVGPLTCPSLNSLSL